MKVIHIQDGREYDADVLLPTTFGPVNNRRYTFAVLRVRWLPSLDALSLWMERELIRPIEWLLVQHWNKPFFRDDKHVGYWMGIIDTQDVSPKQETLMDMLKQLWIPQLVRCAATAEYSVRAGEAKILSPDARMDE